MKKLIVLIVLFLLSGGCGVINISDQPKPVEEHMYKVTFYVGKYLNSAIMDGIAYIETTDALIRLESLPDSIPEGALCYVRVDLGLYNMHPDLERELHREYFTWHGTDKEYKMRKNIIR